MRVNSFVSVVGVVCLLLVGAASGQIPDDTKGQVDADGAVTTATQAASEGEDGRVVLTPDYSAMEKEIADLKKANEELSSKESALISRNAQLSSDLADMHRNVAVLETGQKLLNPIRILSPFLANIGFVCGAVAFLLLVLRWPSAARKVLSLGYLADLSSGKSGGKPVLPLGTGAKWFWAIVAALLILLLILPAAAQEPAAATTTPALEKPADSVDAEKTISTTAPTLPVATAGTQEAAVPEKLPELPEVPTLKPQFTQALDYINFTPLARAIYIMEHVTDGQYVQFALEQELVADLQQMASQKGHPCIIDAEIPPTEPANVNVKKGSTGYYFVLASLYELDGRETVRKELEKTVPALVKDNGAALSSLPFNGLSTMMCFLAAYKIVEPVKLMVPIAAKEASTLTEVLSVLDVAHAMDFSEEYKTAVQDIFKRQQQFMVAKTISKAAMSHGRKEVALIPLEAALTNPSMGLDESLEVIKLLATTADKERADKELAKLSAEKSFSDLLRMADIASELSLQARVDALLKIAAGNSRVDYEKLLAKAKKLNGLPAVASAIASRLKMAMSPYQQVEGVWPGGFAAGFFEKESISLGALIAAHLYLADKTDPQVRELLEVVCRKELTAIIDSYGAKPAMNINDLYALVFYYEETKSPGLASAKNMLALQRQLRGLSDAPIQDARQLALQMELDKLRDQNASLRKSVASFQSTSIELSRDLSEVSWRCMVLHAEIGAKVLLLLIGLWIALVRAIAAAKTAENFRFSHFVFGFTETIGFECCCSVALIIPGAVIVLISQDRIKHLRIMEMQGIWTALAESPAGSQLPPKSSSAPPSPHPESIDEPAGETVL